MTIPSTFVTSATSQITSPPLFDLYKRAGECGDLQGQYPNAAAPTCAGSYSICTFSAGQQGCCDNSNKCQFFTSCNGGLASGTARCTGTGCLQCQSDKPYCTQYRFTEGLSAYGGYACGGVSLPVDLTIQGIVATGQPINTSSTTSSASPTSSRLGNSTSQTSRISSTSSSTSTSATSMASAAAQLSSSEGVHLSTGAIAGTAVAAFLVLAFSVFLIWKFCRRRREQRPMLEPLRY